MFESKTKTIRVFIQFSKTVLPRRWKRSRWYKLIKTDRIVGYYFISMASTGTQEFRDSIDLDEKLVRNSDNVDIANETLNGVHVHRLYSAHHETRLRLVL